MRRFAVAAALVVGLAAAHAAEAWDVRTTDGAIYCRLELARTPFGFRCVRTLDGAWVGFRGDVFRRARIRLGTDAGFRDVQDRHAFRLARGRAWSSSDAAGVTCWHFRRGVTCKAYEGLSFWLGSTMGMRVFRDKPGFRPRVRPLFRTPFGVWCGIELETLEPSLPMLRCWRAHDGREITLPYPGRAATHLWAKSEGFRPPRFRVLAAGATLSWRCRNVEPQLASNCSTSRGVPVLACRNTGARVRCSNRGGDGFSIGARRFVVR